ncbi:hypothetical protein KY311_02140 [Candidatus Woesearchaeota archaeon]|nr:hypothetical protein [Candidatus Woesearchaeota archaeon]
MDTLDIQTDLNGYMNLKDQVKAGQKIVLGRALKLKAGAVFAPEGKEVDEILLQRVRQMSSKLQDPTLYFRIQ